MAITLVKEDGNGLTTSNTYGDVTEFKTYFKDRNVDVSAYGTSQITSSLIAAMQYIDLRWSNKLKGKLLKTDQALDFPRASLYDSNYRLVEGIPSELVEAQFLYTLEHLKGNLYPEQKTGNSKEAKRKKVTVGPITTETEYIGTQSSNSFLKFPIADRIMKKYTNVGSGVMRN